jgi:hypothetical protein
MQVRLIVPNCNRNTSPIVAYGARIARIAGGFTAVQATGGWTDKDGVLVVEPVTVFDCDMTMAPGHLGAWRDLARTIKADLRQDCVYLRIDGIVEYV